MKRNHTAYVVHYESPYHIGFRSCLYGELSALKKQFKSEGKKITSIEVIEFGKVVSIKRY